jgi:hypothetical protein
VRPGSIVLVALALAVSSAARADDTGAAKAGAAVLPLSSPPSASPDEILGEMVMLPAGGSASYATSRVVGPTINMTEVDKGSWKGRIRDYDGVLEVTEKRIAGASFNLVLDRDGDEWVCQGTWDGKRVRIALAKDGLTVRVHNRFYEMTRVAPDLYATQPVGPGLRVKGDAAGKAPLYPQFVLAVLALF